MPSPQANDDTFWEHVLDVVLPLLKRVEGFRATAYPDPAGQDKFYSIGYGHQIKPGDGLTQASRIDETKATELLRRDVASRIDELKRDVVVVLSVNQAAALLSFAYNVGAGAFRTSTLLKLLNAGDVVGAAAQFARWDKVGGVPNASLASRRSQERALFAT